MILDRANLSKFVFTIFNDSGIKYALMRDVEKSLFSSKAKDYDVAIQKEDLPQILGCFRERTELNILYINRRSFCTSIGFIIKNMGFYACFSIDFIFNFSIYGISFTSTKELLYDTSIINVDGVKIHILSQKSNSFVSILPAIYHNYLDKSVDEAESKIIEMHCNSNFKLIKKNNKITGVKLVKWRLVKELRALVMHFFKEMKIYYSRNTITTISFLGPDGAGKTAILSKIYLELSKAFVNHEILHLKPKIFFKKRYKNRGVVTQPHSLKPRLAVLGLLKIVIWNFELAVYYLFTKRHNQTLAIFDRYLLDVLVDPLRYRMRNNFIVRKLARSFLPNITVIVVTEPELAYIRKGEISIGMAEELVRAYTALNDEIADRSVIVINNNSLDDAIYKTYNELHKTNLQ